MGKKRKTGGKTKQPKPAEAVKPDVEEPDISADAGRDGGNQGGEVSLGGNETGTDDGQQVGTSQPISETVRANWTATPSEADDAIPKPVELDTASASAEGILEAAEDEGAVEDAINNDGLRLNGRDDLVEAVAKEDPVPDDGDQVNPFPSRPPSGGQVETELTGEYEGLSSVALEAAGSSKSEAEEADRGVTRKPSSADDVPVEHQPNHMATSEPIDESTDALRAAAPQENSEEQLSSNVEASIGGSPQPDRMKQPLSPASPNTDIDIITAGQSAADSRSSQLEGDVAMDNIRANRSKGIVAEIGSLRVFHKSGVAPWHTDNEPVDEGDGDIGGLGGAMEELNLDQDNKAVVPNPPSRSVGTDSHHDDGDDIGGAAGGVAITSNGALAHGDMDKRESLDGRDRGHVLAEGHAEATRASPMLEQEKDDGDIMAAAANGDADDRTEPLSANGATSVPASPAEEGKSVAVNDVVPLREEEAHTATTEAAATASTFSPARSLSPADSADQPYRPLGQSNGDDDNDSVSEKSSPGQPAFFSVRPGANPMGAKPSLPTATQAIDLGADDAMTDVPISHSTTANGSSIGKSDPSESPTRRKSWFGFGRRNTDDKKASDDNNKIEERDTYAGYSQPSNGPDARPQMGERALSSGMQSVHSVHSVHSAHSAHSAQSRPSTRAEASSAIGQGQVSEAGSRRASQIASPVPSTAVTGSTQASTPRRHAPPAHPFPKELLERTSVPVGAPSSSTSAASASTTDSRPPPPASVAAAAATIVPSATAGPSRDQGIGAKGISAFEKVMSHTRPSHLPPKPKEEDDTHYHQWEEMMASAREHEAQRRRAAEVRRLEREKKLAAYLPKWETLLQGGGQVISQVQEDPALRQIWFEGVPGHLRNKAWSAAIGNPLAMSKDAYKSYVSRGRKAIASGRFPQDTLDAIERDMTATLPQTKMFIAGSPMRTDLQEILTAWVVYRSDDGLGYAPYVSHIAAMLLIPSPPAQAFLNLVNLLSRPCLRAFVTETKDEIDAFYRVFENLQADTFPKIYANCSNLGLKLPESYFRSVLVEQVPFEACCRLWDQIMLDGDGYIFRSALAIFGFLEPRLHYPDKEEILSVLEGRNKATHAITEREKERARLRGEAYDDDLDGKLSVFGLNEEALFEWLETDGWKEARYERLVTREMPD